MNNSDLQDMRNMAKDASDEDKAAVEAIITELEREFSIVCSCGCGARKRNDGRVT